MAKLEVSFFFGEKCDNIFSIIFFRNVFSKKFQQFFMRNEKNILRCVSFSSRLKFNVGENTDEG